MAKKYKMTPQEAWAEWERKRDEIDYRTDLVLKEMWYKSHEEFEKELLENKSKREKQENEQLEKDRKKRKWLSIWIWILLAIIIL